MKFATATSMASVVLCAPALTCQATSGASPVRLVHSQSALQQAPGASAGLHVVPIGGVSFPLFSPAVLLDHPAFEGLSHVDLAAIAHHAGEFQAVVAPPLNFEYSADDHHVTLMQQQVPISPPSSFDRSTLPEMRNNLFASGNGVERMLYDLGKVKNGDELLAALGTFYDRARNPGAAVHFPAVDPVARTMESLAQGLSANATLAAEWESIANDETFATRQKTALIGWMNAPRRTHVFVNSYSFKPDGTPGLNFYDMRPLAEILLANDPNVNVVFVTAMRVDDAMIDHVLHGHPNAAQIKKRIKMVYLNDDGTDFLSQKLLDPKHASKLAEIRRAIKHFAAPAALQPYMGGPYEWILAKRLKIPDAVNAAHPRKLYWGTKSGGIKLFAEAYSRYKGTPKVVIKQHAGESDVIDSIHAARVVKDLLDRNPLAERIAVKLNLGSSGEGNKFPDVNVPTPWKDMSLPELQRTVEAYLREAKVGIKDDNGRNYTFLEMMASEGAWIGEYIPGISQASFPSVQMEILPNGTYQILSSHEQILTDKNNYVGAELGAHGDYRRVIERISMEMAQSLAERGVVGRFGVDFAVVPKGQGHFEVYYIEKNVRKTATLTYLTAAKAVTRQLTGAHYERGDLVVSGLRGAAPYRYRYRAMDHDMRPNLEGMEVETFLGHVRRARNLEVSAEARGGVVFHLVPAIKAAGNVGYTVIAAGTKLLEMYTTRLTAFLNDLEIVHLSGGSALGQMHRYIPEDLRTNMAVDFGDRKTAKAFRAYLKAYPDQIYARGAKAGIVYHPRGYTVIGRDAVEIKVMTTQAEKFLGSFRGFAATWVDPDE